MKYRKLRAPISTQIEITELCNNNCTYCYNHWRENTKKDFKSLTEKDLLFIVNKLIDNKIFSVTLTGGEPLIFWEDLLSAISKLSLSGIQVSLNSNLILLEKEKARSLRNSGLKSVLVSVLSTSEKIHDKISNHQGSWQQTIKGIKVAVSEGIRVSANMVLLKQNFDCIYETAKFLKSIGVQLFSVTKASPALNNRNFNDLRPTRSQVKESLNLLEKIKKELNLSVDILECYPLCLIGDLHRFFHFARRSCTAGITTCTISSAGEIRPCSHSDMIYGNIFKEDLIDIWEKMSDWRDGKYIPIECKRCKFIDFCSGGCRMEAKYLGDICGKDPYMTSQNEIIIDSTSPINHSIDNLNPGDKYVLQDNLRFREEDFGAIVSATLSGAILVNHDGYKILQTINLLKDFTMDDLLKRVDIDTEKLSKFIASIVKRKVISRIKI
ncbi:MAG: hypothetical protein Athens101410_766 [Parcubacteria group bacterium Athens1014_10]|nr:MAG: hypothetical protein Athens101410_766 [Parcubacteria group bacterium Athens1014_10]TSD04827.1 MAG: hypothetical protein Athens071412_611 [Parcubacteria group bacterium Athens0714_12]